MNDSSAKASQDRTCRIRRNLFPHLPARPGLAVGLGVARRRRQILLADDLRGLCRPGVHEVRVRLGNCQSIGWPRLVLSGFPERRACWHFRRLSPDEAADLRLVNLMGGVPALQRQSPPVNSGISSGPPQASSGTSPPPAYDKCQSVAIIYAARVPTARVAKGGTNDASYNSALRFIRLDAGRMSRGYAPGACRNDFLQGRT